MLSRITRGVVLGHKKAAMRTLAAASSRSFASELKTHEAQSGVTQKAGKMQFSKEPVMANFGDLQFGDIPEPLKFVRPFKMTKLSNGIRVCTEKSSGGTAHVGVYVGSGSRNENLASTGTSYLLNQMLPRGTNNRSKGEISDEIAGLGANYTAHADREFNSYGMSVLKSDIGRAVSVLGDMVCNPSLNPAEVEAAKNDVSAHHEDNHNRYQETLLENAHFNSFREHMLGQPIKGDRDMTATLTADYLRDFHSANYIGDNVVVVGTGNIDHEAFVEQVEQHFESLPKTSSVPVENTEKPIYVPAILFLRDDEMVNSNVGVFYDAPGVKHEDYYSFLLMKHMFGNYRIDENAGHINDVHKQYNTMHALLGNLPDVTRADSHYFAYSDAGLFGNYFFGNEVFTRQMNYCGVCMPTIYGHFVNDVEVIRGRNHLFNSLLTTETKKSVNKEIGQNILQLGRRLPRSEIATRAAHIDNYHIKQMANIWFYDAEPSFTNWGPIEQVSQVASYKYFKINTLATVTNAHHSLFN